MRGIRSFLAVLLALGAIAFLWPAQHAQAGAGFGLSTDIYGADRTIPTFYANSPAGDWVDWNGVTHHSGTALRKFVDELPPIGCGKNGVATTNALGQCLAIAEPNTAYQVNGQDLYPGSNYYEIAIVEYREQMHSDLPKLVDGIAGATPPTGGTKIRGYVQIVPQGYVSPTTGLAAVPLDMAHGLTMDIKDVNGNQVYGTTRPQYMGPVIITHKGTPVRIKYTNYLPTGASGDLFIPVDHTLNGAGKGYLQDPNKPDSDPANAYYTDNRTAIHMHGGDTPWISDGTPNQWLVPHGESTQYLTGASLANVPDMPEPEQGTGTLYYTNDISGRLMFYHDHAVGITRLNVYAGMAAGFEIQDDEERALTDSTNGIIPVAGEIPMVIQDKTFVPKDIGPMDSNGNPISLASCVDGTNAQNVDSQDCKWSTTHWGVYGDLWYPNVYEFNQDLTSYDGTNPVGRWDYGPYFWPIFPVDPDKVPFMTSPTAGTWGQESTTPEAFGDTPIVNGTAYPVLNVEPKAYRFRILNASNDKFFNLGIYVATQTVTNCQINTPGSGYNPDTTTVTFSGGHGAVQGITLPLYPDAKATAQVDPNTGAVTGLTMTSFGAGYISAPTVTINGSGSGATASCGGVSGLTEMAMVPFDTSGTFPSTGGFIGTGWGVPDGREGGIPSPATVGPNIIAIGNEGGILPAPYVIPTTPINYEYNKRSVTVLNVFEHGLFMGPAERSDIIVDFSQFAGKTLILYNDSPAPVPAGDPRLDYYTGDPDFTSSGGAATTLPGYGPNTRTVMQIKVANTTPGPQVDQTAINNLTAAMESAYKLTQPAPIVWQPEYAGVYPTPQDVDPTSTAGPWPTHNQFATIRTGSLVTPTFNVVAGSDLSYYPYEPFTLPLTTTTPTLSTTRVDVKAGEAVQFPVQSKAIQELFDFWGRMNATLGAELPFTNANTQTTVPLGYTDPAIVDPVTGDITLASLEKVEDGETQIWKITHNGVDTHPVHIHLINWQLINRVGWDGTIKPPDANELGWKETIRMNPLEDIIVAVRANAPKLPFGIPTSSRYISPSEPPNSTTGFTGWDPLTGNAFAYNNGLIENRVVDLDWEYVWHCHILGHEENDFMRPFIFVYPAVAPQAPTNLTLQAVASGIQLSWGDTTAVDYANHTGAGFGNYASEIGYTIERSENGAPFVFYASAVANQTTFTDSNVTPGVNYLYQVKAYNAAGTSGTSNIASIQAPSPQFGVLSPNGGEVLAGLSSYTVTWNAYPGANSYAILYSATGSAPWTLIQQVGNVTSYNMTVPNVNTTTAIFRIVAYNGTTWLGADNSNGAVTIQGAGIVVTPNGGEVLNANSHYAVAWTAFPGANSYAILYSTTGVAPWSLIAQVGNVTSYDMIVPSVSTTTAIFRVVAYNGTTWLNADNSDGPVTIQQGVAGALVSPNGGEVLTGLSNYTVTWNAFPGADSYAILYSATGSAPWTLIKQVGNVTSYNMIVPNVNTATAIFRVVSYNGTTWLNADNSNGAVTIQGVGVVVTPNGGEVLTALGNYTVTWTAFPGANSYAILYSTTGSAPWSLIGQVGNVTSYNMTVPNTNTTTARLRIVSYNGTTWLNADNSDGTFTIAP